MVEPTGELRLAHGPYQEKARELGLVFHARTTVEDQFILKGAPETVQSSETASTETEKQPEPSLPPGFIIKD